MSVKRKFKTTAIIVAAGKGTRMGTDIKKQFIKIHDIPVIIHTLKAFEVCDVINNIIVVTATEDISYMLGLIKDYRLTKVHEIVSGGSTRAQSVINGLKYAADSDYVAIHDGARPCITPEIIEKTVEAAVKHNAAFCGVKVTDTIKSVNESGFVTATVDRTPLWRVQTPQCFETSLITKAYEGNDSASFTDDCMAAEATGIAVYAVEGSSSNIKITTRNDILIAESILK